MNMRRFYGGARIAYLAGPIANVTPYDAKHWRMLVQEELHKIGVVGFDPARAWGIPHGRIHDPVIERIQAVDDLVVAMSDVVVVRYEPVESRGTDHEIRLACSLDKTIYVWADRERLTGDQGVAFFRWLRERFPGCTDQDPTSKAFSHPLPPFVACDLTELIYAIAETLR